MRALGACGRNEHARKGVSAMRLQACGVEMGSSGDLHGQDSTVSAEAPFPPKKSAELRQFLSIVIPSRLQDIVRRGAEARGFAAHGRLFFGLLLVLIAATGFVFKEQICLPVCKADKPAMYTQSSRGCFKCVAGGNYLARGLEPRPREPTAALLLAA